MGHHDAPAPVNQSLAVQWQWQQQQQQQQQQKMPTTHFRCWPFPHLLWNNVPRGPDGPGGLGGRNGWYISRLMIIESG